MLHSWIASRHLYSYQPLSAKEIWDRVKKLVEDREMTKQERDSMLYDEFDKFTSEPGESIHSYYLRYAKLINDMKMIPMSMSNMQINTKFVNHLQPEWSRFVTTTEQARDLHSVNFDHLYAFLKHNEKDAKEVREMRQRFPKPLALLANTYNPPPSYSSQQIHYAPTVVQQPPILQPDIGSVVPTFLPTCDLIASLNKSMIFLSYAYSSRYSPTNNQLRTSSNPRTQAIIQNGQVTVQNVQGIQSQGYAGNAGKNQASEARVVNTVGIAETNQPRVIRCYNCNCEGHIAKQCTAKNTMKDPKGYFLNTGGAV
ncbi:reverse transcriptase domain-containing protein [Tanacetum coccineum]